VIRCLPCDCPPAERSSSLKTSVRERCTMRTSPVRGSMDTIICSRESFRLRQAMRTDYFAILSTTGWVQLGRLFHSVSTAHQFTASFHATLHTKMVASRERTLAAVKISCWDAVPSSSRGTNSVSGSNKPIPRLDLIIVAPMIV
jgi:hypothetical protein